MARMTKAQREAYHQAEQDRVERERQEWTSNRDQRFVHILELAHAFPGVISYSIQLSGSKNLFITLRSYNLPDEFVDYHHNAEYDYLFIEAKEFITRANAAYEEHLRKQKLRKELLSRLTDEEKEILGVR